MAQGIGKDRVEPRTRAVVRATLRDSRSEREICIIDVSTRGLLATTANPPLRGAFVELVVGCNRLTGQVKWASQRRFGVALRERVSVAAIAEGGTRPAALARSKAVRKRRGDAFSGLQANPQLMSRLGEYLTLGAAAAAAAYLIVSYSGIGMEPVQQAVVAMNGK